ncbi:type VII secretion integral membrane protein EccD [Plantactinospora mayteni]|uniref:Type VII secretion integral membrane protein EccD n=2 Tax=Plantactinospora mayteni TaxID=566021 RepID=A0ABQ4F096_9ACTN|nr:type VII secretion integral membrane protein EccD [Plantactinospora mayteni]
MSTSTTIGLTRIVLMTPRRRVDMALPDHLPLTYLQPALLRHGGDGLAEDGVPHGGWVVRRLDGSVLEPVKSLTALGVRDGEVLLLSPRDQHWPEPGYDDLADGVAEGAARQGRVWNANSTFRAGLAATAVVLGGALVLLLLAGPALVRTGQVALAVAAVLVGAGAAVARWRREPPLATLLGTYGMGYAAVGGALVPGPTDLGAALAPWPLLVGSAALLLAAALGLAGLDLHRPVWYAGLTIGLLGAIWALVATEVRPAAAAAGVAAGLVLLAPVLPRLASAQGGLPTPEVPRPGQDLSEVATLPPLAQLAALVRRADELLTGVLAGSAAILTLCVAVLVREADVSASILAALVVLICALRMRTFAAVRHRIPLGLTALVGAHLLLGAGWLTLAPATRGDLLIPVLAGLLAVAAGTYGVAAAAVRRPLPPTLGRVGDIIEIVCVVLAPLFACAVLGLFGLARGLFG